MAFFNTSAAWGGPMVTAATVPPCAAFSCIAASMAFRSSGFITLATPSRQRLPVLGSSLTSLVFGICFTKTRILISLLFRSFP